MNAGLLIIILLLGLALLGFPSTSPWASAPWRP